MRWNILVLASCLASAGCVGNSMSERQDADVRSSLQYDSVPCDQLLAQRAGLARQYRLPVDAKPSFSNPAMGFGPFTPDMRSKSKRDSDQARGKIDAMNRSMARRECGKPAKPDELGLPG
ncbi:hypothetical protein GCM10010869_45470 [Mesorhizobium tianshanense]|uniref:Lipoprotein n=1 Tax=Mesorhizobium tianshanense TaxID=39844 RepID=A0A562NKH7_9HYPH|nr:hypothetical protein [Mesorhizobium tianshanense]TWI32705.1 hypothetical protein IQ26_04375 [Mesorhizobium tianshanense]GLS38950.1 hypothetical protein GCM10010869_45470 [Mesorhizobium tianshanense]